MSSIRALAPLALSAGFATISAAQDVSGSGTTTRYWDCCKGSCAWTGKADVSALVTTCNIDDQPLTDASAASGCDGGTAYMCSDQSPWAVNSTLAYGFAAVSIPGGSESTWCCACYELTFTSTAIAGKKMIVQATNTGADLAGGQFDLAMPGGGFGIYNGCTDEWATLARRFRLPSNRVANLRFGDFFEGADNPTVDYKQVTCPKALTDKARCIRAGETPTGGDTSSSASAAPATSSAAAASSYSAPASNSSEAAASSSRVAASSYSAPAASSSEAAPASSSSAASPPAYSPPASSSSEAAPVPESSSTVSSSKYVSSPYSFTATYSSASSPVAPINTAPASGYAPAPSGYTPGGDDCQVQYVYEYDL